MEDLIRYANPDVLNYIGTALLWWGIGVGTVSIVWWVTDRKVTRQAREILHQAVENLGHVITECDHGDRTHMQCICGEASLHYLKDDPTGDRLMEQWAEEHIDSRMESAGR